MIGGSALCSQRRDAKLSHPAVRFGDFYPLTDMLTLSVGQRPQVKWLSTDLGWAFTAQRKYESAAQMFYQATDGADPKLRADSDMGVAVTEWNQKLHDRALPNYRAAVAARSAWADEQWVVAFYGPQVGATTQAIHAEVERRKKAEHTAK